MHSICSVSVFCWPCVAALKKKLNSNMLCCLTGYIDAIDYTTGTLIIETLTGKGAKLRLNGMHLLI
jgi:hypothetical protein